jgi:hypothetical protein
MAKITTTVRDIATDPALWMEYMDADEREPQLFYSLPLLDKMESIVLRYPYHVDPEDREGCDLRDRVVVELKTMYAKSIKLNTGG